MLDINSNKKETMYLLSSKNNKEALNQSIDQMKKGETKKYNSIDEMFGK